MVPLSSLHHKEVVVPQFWVTRMIKLIPARLHEPLFLVLEGDQRYPVVSSIVEKGYAKVGGGSRPESK